VFSGTALPNSFVTVYIFSTPIVVTVKTDGEGKWQYVHDKELPDGSHELYVAIVNNEGRIVARSPSVPFIKTAEAIEFSPLAITVAAAPYDPIDALLNNFVALTIIGVLLFVLLAVLSIGIARVVLEKQHIALDGSPKP
jgi:hypothetical protein